MMACARRALLGGAVVMLAACGGAPTTGDDGPAPAGSQLPRLSATADGRPVLSWVEPDGAAAHRLRYSRLDADGWGAPVTVARGSGWFVNWADVPSVVPLTDTLWAAHWLVSQGRGTYAYDVALATSTDGGRTWSAPITPYPDDSPTEHGFVSIWAEPGPSGDAEVGLAWLDGRHMVLDPARGHDDPRTTLRAAVVAPDGQRRAEEVIDDRVCDCCPTSATRTPAGTFVAYRGRTAAEIRDIHVARRGDDGWQRLGAVAAEGWHITGCPVNGPAIAAGGDVVAVAWYTEAGGKRRVRSARRRLDGGGWSEPVDVATGTPAGRVGLTWVTDDVFALSWLEDLGDGAAAVRVVTVDDAGPGSVTTAATTGAGRRAGVPRIAGIGGDVLVAWTSWHDDVPRVRVTRLPDLAERGRC